MPQFIKLHFSIDFVYSVFGYNLQCGLSLPINICKQTTSEEENRDINRWMQVLWYNIEACWMIFQ